MVRLLFEENRKRFCAKWEEQLHDQVSPGALEPERIQEALHRARGSSHACARGRRSHSGRQHRCRRRAHAAGRTRAHRHGHAVTVSALDIYTGDRSAPGSNGRRDHRRAVGRAPGARGNRIRGGDHLATQQLRTGDRGRTSPPASSPCALRRRGALPSPAGSPGRTRAATPPSVGARGRGRTAARGRGDDRAHRRHGRVHLREEAQWMRGHGASCPVEVIPAFDPSLELGSAGFADRRGLLFVAGWLAGADSPNGDGLLWFVQEVLPLIEARIPWVQLDVSGANPPESLRWLEGPTVTIPGQRRRSRRCARRRARRRRSAALRRRCQAQSARRDRARRATGRNLGRARGHPAG